MAEIDKVGLELEGGWSVPWDDESTSLFKDNATLVADESIREIILPSGKPCEHVGEVNSPALAREQIASWLSDHYPTIVVLAEQDGSGGCGLHVHTSFKSVEAYQLLGSWSFYQHFIERMGRLASSIADDTEQAHFIHRLAGKNKYCTRKLLTSRQMLMRDKHDNRDARRTQLNFAWGIHGTLECRLFPMFTKEQDSLLAIEWLLDTYEGWLEQAMPKKASYLSGGVRLRV